MGKFEKKINLVFENVLSYGDYDYSYVKLHSTNTYDDNEIASDIKELDFLISLLTDFYSNIISDKSRGNYIELGKLMLIREYINDVKAIREIAHLQLENQVISLARNFMERTLVVILAAYDDKFCNELFLNSNKLTEKERYYHLFRPKKIISRIKSLSQIIPFSDGGLWDETYSFFSKFVHNDVSMWLNYYDEGYKYNLSLSSCMSKYFKNRMQYIIQAIIFSAASIMVKYKDIQSNYDICRLLSAYMQATIDTDYIE